MKSPFSVVVVASLISLPGLLPAQQATVAGPNPLWTAADVEKLRASGQRVPAYMLETWDAPKAVAVWAKPGETGDLSDPANWLINGQKVSELPFEPGRNTGLFFDGETDLYFPKGPTPYKVGYAERPKGGVKARHITVEEGVSFGPAQIEMTGNLWLQDGAKNKTRYSSVFLGNKNTVVFNDRPRHSVEEYGKLNATAWPEGTQIAQYLQVKKEVGVGVEFRGHLSSSDDFIVSSGNVDIAEDAQILPGTRSTQKVPRESVMTLHSGAEFGKVANAPGYQMDMVVSGTLRAGTPEFPLTRSAALGVSFKDPANTFKWGGTDTVENNSQPGLIFAPSAKVDVFSKNPADARLIIRWVGRHNRWYATQASSRESYSALTPKIEIAILGALELSHVTFEDLAPGGLVIAQPGLEKTWTDVKFGSNSSESASKLIVNQIPERMVLVQRIAKTQP
jgi:hypothetical protein